MRSYIRAGYLSSVVAAILLAGCAGEPDTDPANMQHAHHDLNSATAIDIAAFEQQRQEVLAELKILREDINNELKRYEERSVTTSMDLNEQEFNQQIIKDLQKQRTLMDRQIEKVERAAVNEWNDMRGESESAVENARSFDAQLKAASQVDTTDLRSVKN